MISDDYRLKFLLGANGDERYLFTLPLGCFVVELKSG
jgi:hypothetical protein